MRRPVVLNTRSRDQASELSCLLRVHGFDVIEVPAIAIAPAWDPAELETIRETLRRGGYKWVVLPSQNAARGLEAELRSARIACGSATAMALGLQPEISLERFSALGALEALRPHVSREDSVLIPRAAEGRDQLIRGLRDLGVNVVAPVAYRTIAVESAASRLRSDAVDVVVLCSPSAVMSVAGAIGDTISVVCLGETTATAARSSGVRVDAVATRTTMSALVEAIEGVVETRV